MEQDNLPYEYADLIFKHFKGDLTAAEQQRLDDWLAADARNRELLESFRQPEMLSTGMDLFSGMDTDAGWEAVASRAGYEKQHSSLLKRRIIQWSVAASILAGLALVWKWPFGEKQAAVNEQQMMAQAIDDVQPGGNKAILQLANGQTVSLGDQPADTITERDGTKIRRQQGQLVYNGQTAAKGTLSAGEKMQYNLLSTPKGGQYKLILADGTAVWLNASSSLRFPVQFAGEERVVELTGEGYFEVAKDRRKPFLVKVNGMEVAVLGTHFNVMAYKGVTKTTLSQGAVKIRLADKRSWQLAPGQQAVVAGNKEVHIGVTDIEKALAWKNGVFYFKDDEIADIMEQVARWYDVEIRVKGTLPAKRINGNIRRQAKLSQVLDMLNFVSGAKFNVEGRIIEVSF